MYLVHHLAIDCVCVPESTTLHMRQALRTPTCPCSASSAAAWSWGGVISIRAYTHSAAITHDLSRRVP